MGLFHLFLVSLIQGLTEFLPVSSSGHLILVPAFTGMQDQGQTIDVAVHIGTLGAVMLFFRKDVALGFGGLIPLLKGDRESPGARLAWLLILATIPVIIIGLILNLTGLEDLMRSEAVIGWAMLVFGIVLYWADKTGTSELKTGDWSSRDAIWMGLAQAIALIPGTSRSGITITAARRLGYNRRDAAKLSMLMSIPTIIASGTLLGIEVAGQIDASMLHDILIATGLAFASALAALALMMRLLESVNYTPYVIYRIILGGFILFIVYG